MSKRILVLGASGFIGGYLVDRLKSIGHDVVGTYCMIPRSGMVHLDLLDEKSLTNFLLDMKPDLVVFLSGTKDVARCEKEPAYALDLNVQTVRNYLASCTASELRPETIFFSTDYVFDGQLGHYTAASPLGPKTVYGATNMIAERLFKEANLPSLTLRVSAIMGRRAGFYRWLEESLLADKPIELFNNTFFTPTTIGRLCDYVEKIVNAGIQNGAAVAHLSNGYRMTRFEFGRLLAARLKKPQSLISAKKADTDGFGFQADLSLLPSGSAKFFENSLWNEFGEVY